MGSPCSRTLLSGLGMLLLGEALAVVACSDDASPSVAAAAGDGGSSATSSGSSGTSSSGSSGASSSGSSGSSGDLDASRDADAPPGYTPRSIPGLALWLESTTGLGPQLTTWADQSGAGNDATLSTGAEAPDRNAGVQNGHAGLVFHGYSSYEVADVAALQFGADDFLVEAVCHNNYNESRDAANATNSTTWSWYEGRFIRYRFGEVVSKIPSGFGPGLSLVYNDWTDRSFKIVGQVDTTAQVKIPSGFYLEEPRLLGFRRKGGVLELRAGGAVTATMQDAGANTDVSAVGTKFFIGGRPGLTHFVGAIWEVIAVKGTVADADVAAFEAYARAKYAL